MITSALTTILRHVRANLFTYWAVLMGVGNTLFIILWPVTWNPQLPTFILLIELLILVFLVVAVYQRGQEYLRHALEVGDELDAMHDSVQETSTGRHRAPLMIELSPESLDNLGRMLDEHAKTSSGMTPGKGVRVGRRLSDALDMAGDSNA